MGTLKELFTTPIKKNTGTRGAMLVLVGGYIAYLGYKMYRNTLSGASSMSMQLTVILMSVMILAGLAVIVYGGIVLYHGWKDYEHDRSRENAIQSQEDSSLE